MCGNCNPRLGIIITGFTGVLACNFGAFHEDVERLMERLVFTHEFPELRDQIKELYRDEFLELVKDQ